MRTESLMLGAWLGTTLMLIIFFVALTFQIHRLQVKIDQPTIGGTTVPAVHYEEVK